MIYTRKVLVILCLVALLFTAPLTVAQDAVDANSNQTIEAPDTTVNIEETSVDKQVTRSISPTVDLVSANIQNGETVLIFESNEPTSVEVVYPRGNDRLGRFSVDIPEGTTELTMQDPYGQLALWNGNVGIQYEVGGDGIVQSLTRRTTSDNIDEGIIGGGIGATAALVSFVVRRRKRSKSRFKEVIWGYEDVRVRQFMSWTERVSTRLKSNKIAVAIIGGLSVVIAWYYNITFQDIPMWAWVFAAGFALMFVVIYIFAPSINNRYELYDPDEAIILQLNASRADSEGDVTAGRVPAKAWVGSPELVDEVDFEGEKRTVKHLGKEMHIVIDFNPAEMKAEASDLMQVPEWELAGYLEAIEENRARTNLVRRWAMQVMREVKSLSDEIATQHHLEQQKKEREQTTYKAENIENTLSKIPGYNEIMKGGAATEAYEKLNEQYETPNKEEDLDDEASEEDV